MTKRINFFSRHKKKMNFLNESYFYRDPNEGTDTHNLNIYHLNLAFVVSIIDRSIYITTRWGCKKAHNRFDKIVHFKAGIRNVLYSHS